MATESACHMCGGARARIITTPVQGSNVYRDGRDPKHRATSAARAGVSVAERQTVKRFTRNRKHVTGAPFEQRCLVCCGDGVYAPLGSQMPTRSSEWMEPAEAAE